MKCPHITRDFEVSTKSTSDILKSFDFIRQKAEEVEQTQRDQALERIKSRPVKPTDEVVESNALARAEYRMTANENRLLKVAVSKLDSNLADADQLQDIPITAQEFVALFETEPKNAYRDMAEASTRLLNRKITVSDEKQKITYNLLTQVAYRKHEGMVIITLNPRLAVHLIGLRDRFTKMIFEEGFRRLKLFSSQRLYEIMKSVESQSHYEIGLDAFKARVLADPKKYKRFADLKKRVLEPALAEINTLTDIQVSYEPVRESRKIKRIRFRINKNDQKSLDLG